MSHSLFCAIHSSSSAEIVTLPCLEIPPTNPNVERVEFVAAGAAVGRASFAGAADCRAPAVDAAVPRASALFDAGDSSISFVTVGLYGIGGGVIGFSWEWPSSATNLLGVFSPPR